MERLDGPPAPQPEAPWTLYPDRAPEPEVDDVNTPHLPHPASPDEMSNRARVYLYAGTFRHLTTGLFTLFAANQFSNAVFIPIINFVSLYWWGWAMVGTAASLAVGATLRNRTLARVGLIMSATVTALLASGLWLGATGQWLAGGKATPILAITLTALVVKDLAVCTNPMKTPLEFTRMWRVALGGSP